MSFIKKLIKRKKFWIILGILFLIAGGYFVFSSRANTLPVKEVGVESVIVTKTISASGQIDATKSADLSFAASGVISQVRVEKGDQVSRGQLLATLDSSALQASAQSAKDARDIALRNKESFIEQYENDKDLAGGDTQYEIKLRTLDEQISQADANYDAAVAQLRNANIIAPFSGTVAEIYKNTGEVATASVSVIKIAQLDDLVFEINLDQEDFGLLTASKKVEVVLDAYPDEVYAGEIRRLPVEAATDSTGDRNFLVEIGISNGHGKPILLGMTGDANIVIDTTEKEVPALFFDEISYNDDNEPFVWVEENGLLKKQPIEIGLEGDLYVELLSKPESKIVIPSVEQVVLQEGAKAVYVQ